jgi:hypothetical protein
LRKQQAGRRKAFVLHTARVAGSGRIYFARRLPLLHFAAALFCSSGLGTNRFGRTKVCFRPAQETQGPLRQTQGRLSTTCGLRFAKLALGAGTLERNDYREILPQYHYFVFCSPMSYCVRKADAREHGGKNGRRRGTCRRAHRWMTSPNSESRVGKFTSTE